MSRLKSILHVVGRRGPARAPLIDRHMGGMGACVRACVRDGLGKGIPSAVTSDVCIWSWSYMDHGALDRWLAVFFFWHVVYMDRAGRGFARAAYVLCSCRLAPAARCRGRPPPRCWSAARLVVAGHADDRAD